MSGKFALIIGNTEYTDPGLAQLTAPGKDAEDFARVLQDKEICSFDEVKILLNQVSSAVIEAVDEFFDQKKPDDLLLLYFSGHGVRDELGALYLAVKNTNRFRLRSTAIKSDFIREAMDQSRSKRQVLIMDCCNSGAFAQGTKAATGVSIGTATAFEAGYGRIILTASDSTQFAWEGDKVIGETDNSLFTHFLVEGLEGEADLDGDGRITVDEVYDYAYEKVRLATPKQTPSKFSSKQQGEIVLRHNMRMEDIKPATLPAALLDSLENPFSDVRLGAVQQLIKLLNGKNLGLARAARETLERIAEEDDSRTVSRTAFQAVEAVRQAEQLASQKAGEERLAAERKAKKESERLLAEQKAEEERKAKKEAKRLAALKAIEEADLKAEEERSAREKAEAEQKAREERKAKREAKRLATLKAKDEQLAREKAEAGRKAKEKADRLAKQNAEEKLKARTTDPFFRMIVEDVFSITGRGTVVTGKIETGTVRVGDEVAINGKTGEKRSVVTGVEAFAKPLDQANVGDMVGVLLRDIAKQDIQRGDVLLRPSSDFSREGNPLNHSDQRDITILRFLNKTYDVWQAGKTSHLTKVQQEEAEKLGREEFVNLYFKSYKEILSAILDTGTGFEVNEFLMGLSITHFVMTNRMLYFFMSNNIHSPITAVRLSDIASYETRGWWRGTIIITLKSGKKIQINDLEVWPKENFVNAFKS